MRYRWRMKWPSRSIFPTTGRRFVRRSSTVTDRGGALEAMSHQKLLHRVLSGRSDANIHFRDLRRLVVSLGFEERVRGSHHIFVRQDIEVLINLQREGTHAQPYQVRQVRAVLVRHRLGGEG